MLGSTFVFPSITAAWGGPLTPALPDAVSDVLTLQLRNNDNFGAAYGLRGALHDHQVLIRNSRESPVAGRPAMTRHNAEYSLTQRSTVTAGVTSAAIPYFVNITVRLPETGTQAMMASMFAGLTWNLGITSVARLIKMMNFES